MAQARIVVGLPVLVDVNDDGTVHLSVCPDELMAAARESEASEGTLARIELAMRGRRLVTAPMQQY